MFSHNDKGKKEKKMHITKIINESGDIANDTQRNKRIINS